MGNIAGSLQPKHYKALELWEEGILSIKEIAKACKIPEASMYDLFEGDTRKVGQTAHLFKSELDKITQRTASKVRHLVKDNKKQALLKLNERLKILRKMKTITPAHTKEIVSILNALNKATPGIEIGSWHSLNVSKGLTAEELVYEFQRLKAIANDSFNPKGIREARERGQGGIPGSPTDGGPVSEES